MTLGRLLLLLLSLALVTAALVAFVSRTPLAVRQAGPDVYELEPGQSRAQFSAAAIARHAAYRGPLYLALALGTAMQIALVVGLRGAPVAALVRGLERVPGGYLARAAAVAAAIAGLSWLVAVPLNFVRGHAIQHAWRLSTQDLAGWLSDQAKGVALSATIAAIAAAVFFAIVRWRPTSWWLWVAAAFSALTVLLVLLFPLVIAPLFNRFVPLQDEALKQRILAVADESGVAVDEVLVVDGSRRSTVENAYVAGLGPTKQVVVYDTLLEGAEEDQLMFVVAHELAHRAQRHILKHLAVSVAGLCVGVAALAWLVARGPLLRWAGVASLADVRVLPGLLLFALLAGVVAGPIEAAVSRSFERAADRQALEVVDDATPAASAFRRLAIANLADLRPPPLAVWLLYTHPPIVERIRAAEDRMDAKP